MINISELRHNNWYLLDGKPFRYDATGYIHPDIKRLEPIIISDDVLARCGLKAKDTEDLSEHFHFKLADSNISFFMCSIENGEVRYFNDGFLLVLVDGAPISRIRCPYLHQLQSVYFWLMNGRELEYNPF